MNSEDHELKAQCRDCGHGPWELQKDDPADYEGGAPRCANPDCRSRDVVLIEQRPPEEEPVAARAFRRFREGESPLELVEAGICDPDEARRLRDEFNELAEGEYILLTADELEARLDSTREEARAAVGKEAKERIKQVRQRAERRARAAAQEIERQEREIHQLEQRLREEYAAGWEDCEEQRIPEIRKQVEEEYEEVEDRLAELAERAT